ncbi:MAG: tetratricopeptide repeat protein [Bernardetiaceae bacterium]
MRKLLAGLLLGLFVGVLPGKASPITDSLRQVLTEPVLADTLRIQTLNTLGKQLRFSNPDSAITCSRAALLIAQRIGSDKYKGVAYSDLGVIYGWVKSDYDSALLYFDSALDIRYTLQPKAYFAISIAATLNNMASVEKFKGNYPRALKLYLDAFPLYKELQNKPGLASCSNNIGELYKKEGNYDQALQYYQTAFDIYKEISNEVYQAIVLSNMASVQKNLDNPDQALSDYRTALTIFEKNNTRQYIPYTLINLASLYQDRQEYERAKQHYLRSLSLLQSTNTTEGQTNVLNGLANLFLAQKQPQKALEYALQSLELAQKSQAYTQLADVSNILSKIYADKGDYPNAYRFALDFKTYSDSITTAEKSREMGRIETEFAFRERELQREKEALEQEQEITRQKILRNILIFGLLLLIGILFGAYRAYRIKQRDNEKIDATNRQLSTKNKIIMDGMQYARRIQTATRPTDEEMQRLFPEHFILFRPRDLVSGDFYWAFRHPDCTVLVVADCTGHGVPGAFMSMLGIDLLNEIVMRRALTRPDHILKEMDLGVRRALRQHTTHNEDGMDAGVLVIHHQENKVSYAGARHPLVYFEERPNEPVRGLIKGDRMSVGGSHINEPEAFRYRELLIQHPTTFYLYSDGYTDQFGGPEDKKIGRKQFLQLLWQAQEKPDLGDQKAHLEGFLEQWLRKPNTKAYQQIDDILVIGVRMNPA